MRWIIWSCGVWVPLTSGYSVGFWKTWKQSHCWPWAIPLGPCPKSPCDIIEGNGHVMSTISRYPRDARKGRSGFCGVSSEFWGQGISQVQSLSPGRVWGSFLCLSKGALLRLRSSLLWSQRRKVWECHTRLLLPVPFQGWHQDSGFLGPSLFSIWGCPHSGSSPWLLGDSGFPLSFTLKWPT